MIIVGDSNTRNKSEMIIDSRMLVRLAVWSAIAVLISALERLIPFPIPWVRLGLANGVTLLVLVGMGPFPALLVSLLRITIVAAIFGTWINPIFIISLTGGLLSYSIMVLLRYGLGSRLSVIGLSVAGAFTHMLTQFIVVAFIFMRSTAIFSLVGPSLIAAIVSGIVVGSIVQVTLKKIPESILFPSEKDTDE